MYHGCVFQRGGALSLILSRHLLGKAAFVLWRTSNYPGLAKVSKHKLTKQRPTMTRDDCNFNLKRQKCFFYHGPRYSLVSHEGGWW